MFQRAWMCDEATARVTVTCSTGRPPACMPLHRTHMQGRRASLARRTTAASWLESWDSGLRTRPRQLTWPMGNPAPMRDYPVAFVLCSTTADRLGARMRDWGEAWAGGEAVGTQLWGTCYQAQNKQCPTDCLATLSGDHTYWQFACLLLAQGSWWWAGSNRADLPTARLLCIFPVLR
jgi:hypothetical protein